MKTELHIFTNCHLSCPDTELVRQARRSFIHTFGDIKHTLWCDSHGPKERFFIHYKKNLLKYFPAVNKTRSLSDGYIRAIIDSDADYLFMLEGDWIFEKDRIRHSLDEIIINMEKTGIYHLRFNKRENQVKAWDKSLNPYSARHHDKNENDNLFHWCETPILSNNPHIIERAKYIEFIRKGYIIRLPGSKGIEELISTVPETWGAIYGPLGYPATVKHLDGRKNRGV